MGNHKIFNRCSEELDTLDNFKDLLNRACDFGVPHCQRTCHSLGRQDGNCSATGCTCANERLSSTDFALCAAESTCRLHCQSGEWITHQFLVCHTNTPFSCQFPSWLEMKRFWPIRKCRNPVPNVFKTQMKTDPKIIMYMSSLLKNMWFQYVTALWKSLC